MSAVAGRSLAEDLDCVTSMNYGRDHHIPLMKLAESKNPQSNAPAEIKKCVLAGMNVDIEDSDGNTALMRSVWHRAEANVVAFLEMGADPNRRHLLARLLMWRLPADISKEMEINVKDKLSRDKIPPHDEAEKIRRIATHLVCAGALSGSRHVGQFDLFSIKLEAIVTVARQQKARAGIPQESMQDAFLTNNFAEHAQENASQNNPYIDIHHVALQQELDRKSTFLTSISSHHFLIHNEVAVNRFAAEELVRLSTTVAVQAQQKRITVISDAISLYVVDDVITLIAQYWNGYVPIKKLTKS